MLGAWGTGGYDCLADFDDNGTVGGSEPACNLSSYLGTKYKNDREVTFITGPSGPGNQDVWMTGYLDGTCDITVPIGKRTGALAARFPQFSSTTTYPGAGRHERSVRQSWRASQL